MVKVSAAYTSYTAYTLCTLYTMYTQQTLINIQRINRFDWIRFQGDVQASVSTPVTFVLINTAITFASIRSTQIC